MQSVNLSPANQAYISRQKQNVEVQPDSKQNKIEDSKKMKKALVGLAILGAAAVGIACAVKSGKIKKAANSDVVNDISKKISDVKFKNGVATLPDGSKFSGIVEDTLKSGDKIKMEYADGVLQKSIKTSDGTEIIKEYTNGVISKINDKTVDIKKIQLEASKQQTELKKLLSNKDISSKDFKNQADKLNYVSKKQKTQIQDVFNSKAKVEIEEAEKLAREAQEKARLEAEKAAQKAKLKAEKEAAEKLARETDAKLISEFKSSLTNIPDEKLSETTQSLLDKKNKLWSKATVAAKEKGINSYRECDILDALNESDRREYELLNKKIDILFSEKSTRRLEYLDKLLKRAEDKPVNTPHVKKYAASDELPELDRYYDDYRCNDYYRGDKKAYLNVNENLMDSLFQKAPALDEEAVVYRAVSSHNGKNQKFIDSLKDGFVVENPAYTSTATFSKDEQFYQFAADVAKKEDDGVLMRIHLPKGTKGVLGGHNEYLLPRNSQIKINNIEVIDGVKVANCEYILPKS